jgi:hypothetical protein
MKAISRTIRLFILALWLRLLDWLGFQREEIEDSMNGQRWKHLVDEFDQYLRSEYKYKDNEAAYEIRERLREMINEENLNL